MVQSSDNINKRLLVIFYYKAMQNATVFSSSFLVVSNLLYFLCHRSSSLSLSLIFGDAFFGQMVPHFLQIAAP